MNQGIKIKCIILMCLAFILAIIIADRVCYLCFDPPLNIDNDESFTKFKNEQRRHNPYYTTEGYGNVSIDKFGFNNKVDFDQNEAKIICMGSSQTLSSGLNTEQNYVSLLNEKNNNYKAYNLGVNGCFLRDNLYRAPLIKKYFPNCKLIIIETPALPNMDDLDNMKKILLDGKVPVVHRIDNNGKALRKIKEYSRARPMLRMLYHNFTSLLNKNKSKIMGKQNVTFWGSNYETTANEVFKLARRQLGDMPVIIMYLSNYELDREGHIRVQGITEREQVIKTVCKQNNFGFLSLKPAFAEEYNKNRVVAFGFTNSHIGEGHLIMV